MITTKSMTKFAAVAAARKLPEVPGTPKGSTGVRVRWDCNWQEFIVNYIQGDPRRTNQSSYHTTDAADAVASATTMAAWHPVALFPHLAGPPLGQHALVAIGRSHLTTIRLLAIELFSDKVIPANEREQWSRQLSNICDCAVPISDAIAL